MLLHADWDTPALDDDPVAEDVGPFPRRGFLEVWRDHRAAGDLLVAEGGGTALPLAVAAGRLEIAGEADLTDYHCPLGGTPAGLAAFGEALAGVLPRGVPFRFDSLPAEVAQPLAAGLEAGGVSTTSARHEAAAVIDLPGGYDAYLAALRGKDRHEIRRKRRRFAEALGEPALAHDDSPEAWEAFFAMHRAAGGPKGGFLDAPGMEGFFRALAGVEGAVLSLLLGGGGVPVAAAVGFTDERAYYLYNSAYDPSHGAASPGVVLVDALIADAAGRGLRRFDLLKGDEAYKFRMGAVARPLYALEGAA